VTHRERVLTTINREEPDHVPVDMGGTGGLMVDPVYFAVCKMLGFTETIEPYRSGSS
jgi:hypothetical protein